MTRAGTGFHWICVLLWMSASPVVAASFPETDAYRQAALPLVTALSAGDSNAVHALSPAFVDAHRAVTHVLDEARLRVEAAYQGVVSAPGAADPYIEGRVEALEAAMDRYLALYMVGRYLDLGDEGHRDRARQTITSAVSATDGADATLGALVADHDGEILPPRLVVSATAPDSAAHGEAVRVECVVRNVGDEAAENVEVVLWRTFDGQEERVPLGQIAGQGRTSHSFNVLMPPGGREIGLTVGVSGNTVGSDNEILTISLE